MPVVLSMAERAYYTAAFEQYVTATYAQAHLVQAGLPLETFRKALIGYYSLQQRGVISQNSRTLTIIDFQRSSTQERFWVVDLAAGRLAYQTLVAHGKNTGEEYARTFSNREGSEMSSLGFYVTGNTYQGKHGLSLRLQGVDAGYNTNALSRAVVIHGADYVSQEFIRAHGRLGRSQGCPALPVTQTPAIVRRIKGGTVVFASAPVRTAYQSELLALDPALLAFAQSKGIRLPAS
ncbi:murein L,D-transpeptidase catalytic domain family protein [Hymenobacter sp. 102]|uniref:murein L,D-transpeptidase catalytic domain family protein n=1 Tax=Hymenobacter sp. 102 TaxID=3403152 RepID=UPI003CEE64B9